MHKTDNSLEALFMASVFSIPNYQRSYAWGRDQHEVFLEDLREQAKSQAVDDGRQYFLGTLLLHEQKDGTKGLKHRHIVDGQQRLTTSVIFIATALELSKNGKVTLDTSDCKLMRRNFIIDDDAECQKFRTIEDDHAYFRHSILKIAEEEIQPNSPSARRMKEAQDYFRKNVRADEWHGLLNTLKNASLMTYIVQDAATATQVFELQNDRGKKLTDLEALKSYLMQVVYLHTKNPADTLLSIQNQFSEIYRIIDELSVNENAPPEDSILAYFCVANLDWKKDEWRNPKRFSKEICKGKGDDAINWIEGFVTQLLNAFNNVKIIFGDQDKLRAFSELVVLERMAAFWPLILKTWAYDKSNKKEKFEMSCRAMEVYAFRGMVGNLRSDGGMKTIYAYARDFKGDFDQLLSELKEICGRHNLENRFRNGLDNPEMYETDKEEVRYLLWRYENHLRRQRGTQSPQLSWRDYMFPSSNGAVLSIEHITAQGDIITKDNAQWDTDGRDQPFEKIALHRLGNLVLDSVSPNAAKGKQSFSEKLKHFLGSSTYLSQGELERFCNEKDADGKSVWNINSLKKRHQALVEFALKEWDTNFSHTANSKIVTH